MINQDVYALGAAPNQIREIFAYGIRRKAEIGADKVFDLSLGNPSVPTPACVDAAIERYGAQSDGLTHGYTESAGLASVRQAMAENLNARFGQSYTGANIYVTSGASSSLAIALRGLVNPGEEVIVNAPYFPEYQTWIFNAGGTCVEVPTRADDFQLDVPAIEAAITEKTAMVIINSPNNPVGAVYSDQNLADLAAALQRGSERVGHPIYLLSDEPYRELYYDGCKPAWVPNVYANTVVAYSWSKSMSLPGERIAYVLVPNTMPGWEEVFLAIAGGGRALGHICASILFQQVVAECIDAPVDKEPYDANRKLLAAGLADIGYTFVKPQGAFYMWIEALEPDANAFCERAKAHELLLVPSDGFGVKGWVRAGYCCGKDVIEGSLPAFKALWEEYHR